ncbi:NAD-dependent malic enzyme [compost metagenome]
MKESGIQEKMSSSTSEQIFAAHQGGKLSVESKLIVHNSEDLAQIYTPGVAQVCSAIHQEPDKAYTLTIKNNTVAVITDGTSVLGLGDIGPYAAAPVMEGKAVLFKQLAGVDAFPICLDTTDSDEIIRTIQRISPIFAGINLEDISSPRCFEIESRLASLLDIPVFHDDQHGTAIVAVAGLINALKVAGKRMDQVRVVVNGIGAAGVAICKMLLNAGVTRLVPVDKDGAIVRGGSYSQSMWQWLAKRPEVEAEPGTLKEVIADADVFIGVSRGGVLTAEDVQKMAPRSIVFAMANPDPEITPEEAKPYVHVFATGRSDYPNQINNALVFPGIFRGALDCRAASISEDMKMAAAYAIASTIPEAELSQTNIVPGILDSNVVKKVRDAVIHAAVASGQAKVIPV